MAWICKNVTQWMPTAFLGIYSLREKYISVHFVKLCLNFLVVNRGRISSVCRGLDCRVAGRGFDSRTGPILRVLKLLINVHVLYLPCKRLDLHLVQMTIKMLVLSPWGDTSYSVLNKYFCASLWKHSFLLTLRHWGRFAQRNVCDSATEIPYWWCKSVFT